MQAKKTKHARAKSVKKNNARPKVLKRLKVHAKVSKVHAKVSKKKVVKVRMSAAALLKRAKESSVKRAANAKTKKLLAEKMEAKERQERQIVETKKVAELVGNKMLLNTVNNSVGTGAVDVLRSLVEGPRTDESIAERLNIKVNDVRRVLNAMNSYSIVRYDVNKDSKGWLIFTWRIDSEKLTEYVVGINKEVVAAEMVLPTNTNDFFMCKGCYSKEKTILPFDSAFESDFTCGSCGKPFALLSREETVALFKTVSV